MKSVIVGMAASAALFFLAVSVMLATEGAAQQVAPSANAKYAAPAPSYHQPGYPSHPYDPYPKPKEPEILVCVARPPKLLSAYPAKTSITVKIELPDKVRVVLAM